MQQLQWQQRSWLFTIILAASYASNVWGNEVIASSDASKQASDEVRGPASLATLSAQHIVSPNFSPGIEDVAFTDTGTNGDFEKRAPMGFQGMRGKKYYQQQYDNMLLQNEYLKRAPMGFQGMRGKKDLEVLNVGDSPYKRAPVGFHGMRGKKEYGDADEASKLEQLQNDNFYSENFKHVFSPNDVLGRNLYFDEYEKRAPMGFQGMRGKKDEYLDEDKRSPQNGFFGMRGKKQPASSGSGFFGMRGKKFPYENKFIGKFVGVRGKKTLNENDNLLSENDLKYFNDLVNEAEKERRTDDINKMMLLLSQNNENNDLSPFEKRKAPDGFFGMRGKRSYISY